MNVNLSPHYIEFMDGLIQSGRYSNYSEMLREGLRRLELDQVEKADLRKLELIRVELNKYQHDQATKTTLVERRAAATDFIESVQSILGAPGTGQPAAAGVHGRK